MEIMVCLSLLLLSTIFVVGEELCSAKLPPTICKLTPILSKSDIKVKQTAREIRLLTLFNLPDGVKNGIASAASSILVKFILQPIDVCKTVQQASNIKLSPLNALIETINRRGFIGLWSGMGATVLGAAPSSAVYFGMYSSTKAYLSQYMSPKLNILTISLSAAIANTLASCIRAPFEVIKQRIQTGAHKTTIEAIIYSFKTDGVYGLFSNGKLLSQIARDVPYAIATLLTYEILQSAVKRLIQRHQDYETARTTPININTTDKMSILPLQSSPVLTHIHTLISNIDILMYLCFSNRQFRDAICGAVAGGLGSYVTTPLDVVKTRSYNIPIYIIYYLYNIPTYNIYYIYCIYCMYMYTIYCILYYTILCYMFSYV